jgi:ABC-type glycerol-3-phosphate transport system substrate-binding protein
MVRKEEIGAIGMAGARYNRRRLLKAGAAASGMAAFGLIPSTIRAGKFVQANATINILAPSWPMNAKEMALAEEWSQQSGIAVNYEAVNYASLEQRIKILVESQSTDYDIYDYDSQWIGGFVAAGALEQLDTPDYLGSAEASVKTSDFYPEIFGPLCQYPSPSFGQVGSATPEATPAASSSPVYGLPWSINAEALWFRFELMDVAPASWEDLRA